MVTFDCKFLLLLLIYSYFIAKGVTYAKAVTNQLDFEAAFNESTKTTTDPGNCSLSIFDALLKATTVSGINIAEGSIQYLVTAAAPSDSDIIVGYQNYFGQMSQYQLKVSTSS